MDNRENKPISLGLLFLDATIVVLIVFMFFLIYSVLHPVPSKQLGVSAPLTPSTAFKNVTLVGKSAFIFDVTENKVIFKKNEFAQLPLASITKLMMALTARELVPRDSHITIRKEFLQETGDTGLLSGESWRM